MLDTLIQFSLRNKFWVLGPALVVLVAGAMRLHTLPVDAVPDITNVQVVINTKTGALDPEKIEVLVTRPIEADMGGLPNLSEMRSLSKYGLSKVTLIFDDGTDLYWIRQQVGERLSGLRGNLPAAVSPELEPITTGLGEVFMYSVEAEPGSALAALEPVKRLTELRSIQDFVIRPQLKRVKGVADVDSNGGYVKQIHINFFPSRLEQYGLTADQLVNKLESLGENFGGGYIQKDDRQIIVRTVPHLNDFKQIEDIPLGLNARGRAVRIRDIGIVRDDHALRVGAATRNGEETVLGTVLMRTGANSRKVAIDSERAIARLELPSGVHVVPLYSRSYLVNATLKTVMKNLLEGAVLVVVVLMLFLGHIRAALLVASAIPLSMLLAGRGMLSFGISANLMSLGAIDFGLIVDGSVVLVENILRRLKAARHKAGRLLTAPEREDVIREASSEVLPPVVFGILLIMLAYVPILSLQGVEGKMFHPMAWTVLMALGASLLIAIFLMPVLCAMLLPSATSEEKDPWLFRMAQNIYEPLLERSLTRTRWFVAGAVVLLLGTGLLMSRMGSDFVPALEEGDLVINLTRDSAQGVDASVRDQREAEKVIRQFPEAKDVFSRMGTPESATDPMGIYLADTFIILDKNHRSWTHPNKQSLFEAMKEKLLAQNPDQDVEENQPIQMRLNEMLEGSRADVTLRILGPDLKELTRLIAQARDILEKVPGAESVEEDALTALRQSPVLDVRLNYPQIARYGLTIGDVNRGVELAMSGMEVGSFYQEDRRLPVIVHLDESLRNRPDVIERLPVSLPDGGSLPLHQLATLDLQDQVTTIARYWSDRYAAISINLKGRDIASFVEEAQARVQKGIVLPEGYRFYWGGQFKNLARARERLWVIVPLTLIGVFLILLRVFGSAGQSLLVFSGVPFATVGGVLALYVRDIPLSVSASVGFIALIGIAMLNGIVLLTMFNKLRDLHERPLREAVIEGAQTRLRPVLMTALVASLGFVPMALNTGIGSEVQRPLATVVIGGLITSTALTLLLLPALYLWLEKRWEKRA